METFQPAPQPRSKARWARTILEQAKPVPLRRKATLPSLPAPRKPLDPKPAPPALIEPPQPVPAPAACEHPDDRWEMVIPKMVRPTATISPAASRQLPASPPPAEIPVPEATESGAAAEPRSSKGSLIRTAGAIAGAVLLVAATVAATR